MSSWMDFRVKIRFTKLHGAYWVYYAGTFSIEPTRRSRTTGVWWENHELRDIEKNFNYLSTFHNEWWLVWKNHLKKKKYMYIYIFFTKYNLNVLNLTWHSTQLLQNNLLSCYKAKDLVEIPKIQHCKYWIQTWYVMNLVPAGIRLHYGVTWVFFASQEPRGWEILHHIWNEFYTAIKIKKQIA